MKRFLLSILSPLRSPILLLLVAFACFIRISKDITGDMGKLGLIMFSKEYHLQDKFRHVSMSLLDWCDTKDFNKYNVIFLGDSFTAATVYPNSLANLIQMPSAKYYADNMSPEQTFVALCNTNVEMPEVVVLESVERYFVSRLNDLDIVLNELPKTSVWPIYDISVSQTKLSDFSSFYKNQFINQKAILNVSLRDSLFTCPRKEEELYFYFEDLRIPKEGEIQTAIAKLDSLFLLANEKNVCLFYVVAADKYDVYQEFAIDNEFTKKEVLEKFVEYEVNPYFVNTKHVLLKNARQGVKDLYYADDTHWSPIGAKIVAEEIARRMDSLGVLRN